MLCMYLYVFRSFCFIRKQRETFDICCITLPFWTVLYETHANKNASLTPERAQT